MNLTDQQKQELEKGHPVELMVNQTECVLLRKDVYQQLMYDDSEWTADEMSALAAQMFEQMDDPEEIR